MTEPGPGRAPRIYTSRSAALLNGAVEIRMLAKLMREVARAPIILLHKEKDGTYPINGYAELVAQEFASPCTPLSDVDALLQLHSIA